MKKSALFLFLTLIYLFGNSQQSSLNNDSSGVLVKDYSYYHQKAIDQKAGAWVLTSAGGIAIIVAVVFASKETEEDLTYAIGTLATESSPNHDRYERNTKVFSIAGAVLLASSVPLFVAGHKNKHKARLLLKNQSSSFILPQGKNKSITGFSLIIPLGK